MKKVWGNLLLFITSFMCVIALFGFGSINSKAATSVKAPTEVGFDSRFYTFKAVSEGYYTVFITNGDTKIYKSSEKKYPANAKPSAVPFFYESLDNLGKITLYVVCSPSPKNYNTLKKYQSDKECKITKVSKTLSQRTPKVEGIKVEVDNSRTPAIRYKVTWESASTFKEIRIGNPKKHSKSCAYTSLSYFYVDMKDYEQPLEILAKSDDLNKFADSEPVTVTLPAVDLEKIYNKGSFEIDLTNGTYEVEDLALSSTVAHLAMISEFDYKIVNELSMEMDLDKNGSYDIAYKIDSSTYKNTISVLPTNSIRDQVTFVMPNDAKKDAMNDLSEDYRFYYETLKFVFSKPKSQDASDSNGTFFVKGSPVDTANIVSTVTVNGITYIIDRNGNATAIKIASKKKASLNTVTAYGKTYPVIAIADNACKNNKKIKTVTIGSNVATIGKKAFYKCKKLKKVTIKANKSLKIGKGAFKKINKDAVIKLNGVKGSKKRKLLRAIKK
ncbi:leucine-rich repeat protein [Butyrivibrio sp. JL13D10]|uniref:leucine-rich repeat protein n=1 Tax=Butyrivibrio sp. JL13D10 TaxID=3236815 RepID=UPI0038B4E09A